jgi:hypothetical protein
MDTGAVLSQASKGADAHQNRWTVTEEERAKIGTTNPAEMTLEAKVDELQAMLELVAKYPPAYGNSVHVPFLIRASELLGRELNFASATDQRACILELAQQNPEMREAVQHARADELQQIFTSTPVDQIGDNEFLQISRLIGRRATIGDVIDTDAQSQLVEQVRSGELTGRLPQDEFLRP